MHEALIGSIFSWSASEFAKALFDGVGPWVNDGAIWLIDEVGAFMGSTTQTGIGTSWFGTRLTLMSELSAAVILPMLFCAVIQAIYRQSAAALLRIFLVNLPIALLMTGVAVELVRIGLAVTDQMSAQFLSAGGIDTRQFLSPLTTDLSTPALGLPSFAAFLIGLFIATASLTIWLELVVRSAAITAAALFLPLVLAALVWPAISHWARRLADTLAALVLSKLMIAAIISLAAGALGGGFDDPGSAASHIDQVVVGLALLLLSAFAPFVLLRLVPAFEAGAVMHLEGAGNRLKSAAQEAIRPAASAAQMLLKPSGTAGVPLSAIGTQAAAGGAMEKATKGIGMRPGGIIGGSSSSVEDDGASSASTGSTGSGKSGGSPGKPGSSGGGSKGSTSKALSSGTSGGSGSEPSAAGASKKSAVSPGMKKAAEEMKDWFPEFSEHLANGTLPETGPGIPSETVPGLVLPSMEMIREQKKKIAPFGWLMRDDKSIQSYSSGVTVPQSVWQSDDFDPSNHDPFGDKDQSSGNG